MGQTKTEAESQEDQGQRRFFVIEDPETGNAVVLGWIRRDAEGAFEVRATGRLTPRNMMNIAALLAEMAEMEAMCPHHDDDEKHTLREGRMQV